MQVAHVNRGFQVQGFQIRSQILEMSMHLVRALLVETRQKSIMYIKLNVFWSKGIQISSLNGCNCSCCARASEFHFFLIKACYTSNYMFFGSGNSNMKLKYPYL